MRKAYLVLLLLLFGKFTLWSQDDMFKSLFIYNFTKNIEWPSEYKNGNFIITVVGNSGITAELEKIAKIKKVGDQSIEIIKVNDITEVGKCNMLYVTPNKSSDLTELLTKCSGKPVVVIGDNPGLAKMGAGINFIKVDGKQKFEINKNAMEKNGLKINSYLLTLGEEVQ